MQQFDEPELEEAREEVGFATRNLAHPECTIEHAGRFYEELSEARRAVAILELLLHGDAAAFAIELSHSGYARVHFLRRCAKEGFRDHHFCASRLDGLFDALAAGQLGIARDIAGLSATAFRPNEEYEEDFWYAHFLHGAIAAAPRSQAQVLKQLEVALEGDASARLALCQALDQKDEAAFQEAFAALLEEHDQAVELARLTRAEEEVAAAAGTYVFVEGLALLWLAERAGLKTGAEYRYCPALARSAPGHAAPTDELPVP